ncbi:MAG: DUF2252 domain-containing protein [Candidatus Obscuribacterales bacterium]|nr:DUF2252 domain-containing protein [Candidatus Obscuribacterales bacterium]
MSQEDFSKKQSALLHDATITPRDDRKDRGKTLRASITRASHAGWKAPANRRDPIELLEESNEGRISELTPIRWGRMMASPFTFFRGAAALMAADLEHTPSTKVYVQTCGDCHLLNFGAFATPERNLSFDINDFDETLPATWEWDLKRLTVSFVLAARENGLKPKFAAAATRAVCSAYREKMAEYARMSILDIWYDRIDWQHVIAATTSPDLKVRREQQLSKAQKRNSEYYFPKLVETGSHGNYTIKDSPPTIYHVEDTDGSNFKNSVEHALERYKLTLQEDKRRLFNRYKFVDCAIKVVGIGSVGTTCLVLLLLAPDDEPLFLQMKEARLSVLEPYAGASAFENRGQRVVEGQRIIQSASDIFLGWTEFGDNGKHFYIRQLRDTKIKLEPELWDGKIMTEMALIMGAVLARAHARSGDSAVISGYLGTNAEFDEAVADFALNYADQVDRDHAMLVQAAKSGRIKALEEVV